jgi:predicted nucleic acid-binding protein
VKAIVDTNVIAYFLLGTAGFRDECEYFWRAVSDLPEALHRLELAKGLGIRSVPVSNLWSGALVRAHTAGIAAYDALFVELADREGAPLATFDAAVVKAFPRLAMRPRSSVARPRSILREPHIPFIDAAPAGQQ